MRKIIILILMFCLAGIAYAVLTATEGLAIDLSSAGAGTDQTISFDPTELLGNITWGDASTDTIVWTWDRTTGTDPTITFNSGSLGLQAITLATDLAIDDGGTGASTLNDLITLTTHTAGNYVASITDGLAIDGGDGGSEGATITLAFDPTELLGNRTWGDASTDTIVWTWNRATGTDPTITFNSGSIGLQALTLTTDLAVDHGGTGQSNLTNLITLTTHTTGNYSDGNAEGGDALVSIAVEITDNENAAENNPIVFVAGAEQAGGDLPLESDGTFFYTPSTGTVTTTEFVGGGAGVTSVDAATGDSATAFFDAGTIEHEWGGLQADVSAYTGLIGITGADTTVEVDTFTELDTAIADKALVNKADGAVWSGVHDFGGATSLEIPNGTDPDVTVIGQISQDTDAADETGDTSMRGYDGANQFLFSKKVKHLTIVVSNPDDLTSWTGRANPSAVVWPNTTGMSFTILEMYSVSDTDNYDYTLFESASLTNMSDESDTSIIAVEVDDDGTECFTSTDTAINHVIEKDHAIIFEHTLGSTNMVTLTISGWFNSDVD